MKKLLLLALIAASAAVSAQYLRTGRTEPLMGYSTVDNLDGTNSLNVTFNTSKELEGYIQENNCKSFQSYMMTETNSSAKTIAAAFNGKYTQRAGSNFKGWHLSSLQALLDFQSVDTLPAYDPSQSFWKAQSALLDLEGDTLNQVMVNYPGMFKRSIWAFRTRMSDFGVLLSDLNFEMMTYDAGTTGQSVTYKMFVETGGKINSGLGENFLQTVADLDTTTEANIQAVRDRVGNQKIFCVDSIYATTIDGTLGKVTVNVAEAAGIGTLQGTSYVWVFVYARGTAGELTPGSIEPMVAFDNVNLDYAPASWFSPDSIMKDGAMSFNNYNWKPQIDRLQYNGGEATPVIPGQAIKFRLGSKLRAADIVLTEDNLDKWHNPKFRIAETGAVKTKDANGDFTVDVPYTYTPSDGTSVWNLHIPLAEGMIKGQDEEFEIAIISDVAVDATSAERFEVTNGTRFWVDFNVVGTVGTAAPSQSANQLVIFDQNRSIVAQNATEKVTIFNTNGQAIRTVTPSAAARGISLPEGAYVVKTGETVQKVIVK